MNLPKNLLALALGGFGIGLTEFAVMGLLPDIATALGITIPEAGHLISAYAAGVVVGAPLLVLFVGHRPPKTILLGLMLLFTVFNGLSAMAPTYPILVVLRFLSGLPHGAFFGVGAIVAARIAGPEKAASAFAVMLGGLTICNIVGVPLATYVGHQTSWRAAFIMVAAVGILTFLAILIWIPRLEPDANNKTEKALLIFKRAELWYGIAIASIGFAGFFAWFSYITPLLTVETKMPIDWIPWMLALAGVGMTCGNFLGGKLSDKLTPIRAIQYLMITMVFVMSLNALLAPYDWAMVILVFTTGTVAMAMGAPMQMLLISSSRESELLGSSVGQAAFNVGNSLGALLAGIPLSLGYRFTSAEWVGAAMAFAGLLIALRFKARFPGNTGGPTSGATVVVH